MSFGNFNLKVNSKSKRKACALLGGGGRLPTVGYPRWVPTVVGYPRWVRIATISKCSGPVQLWRAARGGSPGLAVQGCGRDGTHCCCCCSLLCAAVRAQPLLLQARSAAAALRRCCLLATAGGSGDCGGAVSLLASVNILFLEVELLRFCRKARALLAVMMTQS